MHMSYVRGVEGRTPQIVDVSGKVFIVTGANCGIGLETARMLVEMGGTVVIACRYENS
jgi:NAD(P)-dependent dehydrogenase (short-subunit alcohol dehydrogenase family)